MQARVTAYIFMALVAGISLASLPRAFGDGTDPLTAVWNAISDLQSKTSTVQQQQASMQQEINDLKAQLAAQPANQIPSASTAGTDLYPIISIQDGGTAEQQLVHIVVQNAGSQSAQSVKLTVFYKMSLFDVNSIAGSSCSDQGRGIIECDLGTLGAAQQASVIIATTAKVSGQKATIIADVSSSTPDSNQGNNYQSYDFTTGSPVDTVVQQNLNLNQPQKQQQNPGSASQPEVNSTQTAAPIQKPSYGGNVTAPASNQTAINSTNTSAPSQSSNASQTTSNSTSSSPSGTGQATTQSSSNTQSPSQPTSSSGGSN